jgi:hypothetical protein
VLTAQEEHGPEPVWAHGIDADGPVHCVVCEHPSGKPKIVAEGEDAEIPAEIGAERGFVSEDQPANARVQAVRPMTRSKVR